MINRLSDMLINRGDKYVSGLLNEKLVITEKLDAFRIQFEKNGKDIIFFTNDNKKIDKISRTLDNLWEEACNELTEIISKTNILEGYRYGLYYKPSERPQRIPYSNIEKYILTDISKRNKYNKIIESLDINKVEEWSSLLGVGRPPVIFKGILSEDQNKKLINYEIQNYTEYASLVNLVNELFGSTYSKEPIIEGIIIQTDNSLSQIISYEFDILNEAYKQNTKPRDFYDLIILSITNFMTSYTMPVMESEDAEINYINIICDIFNKYTKKENINENLDTKYLTPINYGEKSSRLNKTFISNVETLDILEKAPIYESLFKVLLASFRKTKNPYGLLDENSTNKFNSFVYLINSHANKYKTEDHLNEEKNSNIVISSIRDRQPSDIDNMRVISSIQKAFKPRELKLEPGAKQCVIYLTSYVPFTQAQLDNISNMKKQWNCNIILAAVSSKYKLNGNKFFLSDELVNAQMSSVQKFNSDIIDGFIMLDSWSLLEIFEYCRPKYEPIAVITDMGKKAEIALQLFFEEEIMNKRIDVNDNFNVGEMENKDALMALRSIEDENFSLFNELVPQPVKNYYNNIVNEYKLWNGSVLK